MTLRQRLTDEMKEGMRARDADRVSVIRLLISTIKNKEIEKGKNQKLSEEEILRIISSAAKQRKESISQFSKGGRSDLVEKEEGELKILQTYLPEPLSEEALRKEVEKVIGETGITDIKQMGIAMKALIPKLMGRAEGDVIRKMVQTCLQAAK
ncbi:MAG: GatB/YqeY domain-containing protein [Nitrospiria bacterium]